VRFGSVKRESVGGTVGKGAVFASGNLALAARDRQVIVNDMSTGTISFGRCRVIVGLMLGGIFSASAETASLSPVAPPWLVEAQTALGLRCVDRIGGTIMHSNSVEWLKMEARNGNAQAEYYLGNCYSHGVLVAKDPAEGEMWHRLAGEHGNARAQFVVGLNYLSQEPPRNDLSEGIRWYLKAARQGYGPAQFFLANCYANGQGVATNESEAAKWYLQAALHGDAEAVDFLGPIYEFGRGVRKDYAEAFRWYWGSIQDGSSTNVAMLNARWKNPAVSPVDAVGTYRTQALQGDAEAQFSLAMCYETGCGVESDSAEALKWFRAAAEHNDAYAQIRLGIHYEARDGADQRDRAEAIKWYKRAARQGNVEARERVKLSYNDYLNRGYLPPGSWNGLSILPRHLSVDRLNALANNPEADLATRAVAIFTLFARHIRPRASATEVHRALTHTRWLAESKLAGIYAMGGWVPLNMNSRDTMYYIRLFPQETKGTWSPWIIYFRLSKLRKESEAVSFFRGETQVDLDARLIEFALSYPQYFRDQYSRIELFGTKGIHVWEHEF
jgi:TPR repeat protein